MIALRMRPNTAATAQLGMTAVFMSVGVLWALQAPRLGGPSAVDTLQAQDASNRLGLKAGLMSQTRFTPTHSWAVNAPRQLESESSDKLLVLALSSTAFLFLAIFSVLLTHKVGYLAKPGQPNRANMLYRSLSVALSVES